MNNLFDTLEICLQEMENGADLETVLARYPDLATELRPILQASLNARSRGAMASDPAPEVMRRGRAKLLQRASEMREQKVAPRKRMIPIFQRLAISLALTATFLASGTGLVGASSVALPGENLYPVKRTWEDVRLFFAFNPDHKELLKSEFENERLDEVDELLTEGRHETIQYTGIFMQVNGSTYVSGVKVMFPANLQAPANGAAVIVTGRTNAQGFVEIESIVLLPDGAKVPVGKPVEVEEGSDLNSGTESDSDNAENSNSGSTSESGTGNESSNETPRNNVSATIQAENPPSFEVKGVVESITNNLLVINGQTVYLGNAKIDGVLTPGVSVEIKGFYAADGSFVVTEVKVNDSASGGDGNNENSGSDSNSNDNSGSNSNDDSNHSDDNGSDGGSSDSGGSGKDH